MSKAITTVDTAFQEFLEAERSRPVQRNLFTGEPEALRVEVPDHAIHELLETLFNRPIDLVTDGSLSERKARIILPTVRYATINS